MEGTPLFDENSNQIFPQSKANSIETQAYKSGGSSVEEALTDIYDKLLDISAEGNAAKSIGVEVTYALITTKDPEEAKKHETWGAFTMPTSIAPYLWKRTAFKYGDKEVTVEYELGLMYPENETETWYRTYNSLNTEQIEITYMEGSDGKPDYDKPIRGDWSINPVSVEASRPYAFMAIRKRVEGKWEAFSDPALYATWTFNSTVDIRYTISSTEPAVSRKTSDPNSGSVVWNTKNTATNGKLWMIVATKVSNDYYKDGDGNIWSEPSLISNLG